VEHYVGIQLRPIFVRRVPMTRTIRSPALAAAQGQLAISSWLSLEYHNDGGNDNCHDPGKETNPSHLKGTLRINDCLMRRLGVIKNFNRVPNLVLREHDARRPEYPEN
jgi:hypothetical protein